MLVVYGVLIFILKNPLRIIYTQLQSTCINITIAMPVFKADKFSKIIHYFQSFWVMDNITVFLIYFVYMRRPRFCF
jgi:hypothetical protein